MGGAVGDSMLIDPEAIVQAFDVVRASHFYEDVHRTIFQSIADLYESHQAVDVLTVTHDLKKKSSWR
jgi:replicative DNA helicase